MSYINVSSIVKMPRAQIYNLFSDPRNFERLMPSNLTLKLVSPYIKMNKGAEYEFRLQHLGVEQVWLLRVDDYVENQKFVFAQSIGSFAKWNHTIKLEDFSETETLIHHFIEYDLRFGLFGKIFDDVYLKTYMTQLLEQIPKKLLQ